MQYKSDRKAKNQANTDERIRQIKVKLVEALEHAEKAEAQMKQSNNETETEFSDHYLAGLRLMTDGFATEDSQKMKRGAEFADKFAAWLNVHVKR